MLTPNVQRRSVSLPPALTIAAQVLLGVLVGALGVALATPLAAAGMVVVNRLYVEEVLEDTSREGRPQAAPDPGPRPTDGVTGARRSGA